MWQFWVDVGGTFTDCVARDPQGRLRACKVLSHSAIKGRAAAGSTAEHVVTAAVTKAPDDFWRGYTLRVFDETGRPVGEALVAGSRAAGLKMATSLSAPPAAGSLIELLSPEEAPLLAIRQLLKLRLDEPLPPCAVKLGTTRGTNALLTRRGAKVALVTTKGFADAWEIGYQNRPDLFALAIEKPRPLYAAVVELAERVTSKGEVLRPVSPDEVREQLQAVRRAGIDSLAVCLLNAYAYVEHERIVAAVARELGFSQVSVSHQVSPLVKLIPRGDTTLVDAYLGPVLTDYLHRLEGQLSGERNDNIVPGGTSLRLMTSAGGLVRSETFTGKDCVLSGPAGGVVGAARGAEAAGFARAIALDMGGTSSDVSRYEGELEYQYETVKAGVRIAAPTLAIETVAAGGGSVCRFDGAKLVVGPESAGANPGPACYGRGGPLTVTDLNVFFGRISRDRFPFPLDHAAIERRLAEVAEEVMRATGRRPAAEELCAGFLRIANTNMAAAIRAVSVAKGYDPREYALVAMGGAAPQHACNLADELGMTAILIHPLASVQSALGIGLADIVWAASRGVYRPYDRQALVELESTFTALEAEAAAAMAAEGVGRERLAWTRRLDLRYAGMDASLSVAAEANDDYAGAFAKAHRRLFGYEHADRSLEIAAARVQAVARSETHLPRESSGVRMAAKSQGVQRAWLGGRMVEAAVYQRNELVCGAVIDGPAIVSEELSTVVVEPYWRAEVLSGGTLLLARTSAGPGESAGGGVSAISLEVFHRQFTSIAEQMGITLQSTASSVNVKERLDFSCAIFSAAGELIVNAPHIPVHLGAMSETVKQLLAERPDWRAGDVLVTNDPYGGGSHLPDVTVVTPVCDPASGERLFFTASRAHHAEIGGVSPGSMPPFSRTLAEEGVLIRRFLLVEGGVPRLDALRELLLAGPYPTRNVADNLADVSAQIAANEQGARDLLALVRRLGSSATLDALDRLREAAERKVRAALARYPQGSHRFTDYLDDGTTIQVEIAIDAGGARIDFTGSGRVLAGNLNANRAIVTAAVMYVLRLLVGEEIPLNEGLMRPVELIVPEGVLQRPQRERAEECAAVVGGNVETSQRVVDVLLGALGVCAASQGTMNNVLLGDSRFGYYETIGGGSGATADADAASAVHTHMTNTRITDPEVIEQRYPMRVREFSIRRGSGGAGRHRGGDGIVRRLEFLAPLVLSLLTQRRGEYLPYGLAGGEAGEGGENWLLRKGGGRERLGSLAQVEVQAGDQLLIKTPGGGGYGLEE